ncbi:hypothetical protein ABIE19_001636 [Brevundimonas faecalis]|uniref:Helix-turn-helix domain-containing protein n=1 Tax=Brevundimonas faecalis TaxID=947378 RepID=A0ABV2RAU0_9CAUL
MQSRLCHAQAETPSQASDARDLIIRVLSVRKVAQWCDVTESAVHQWIRRGSAAAPVPVKVVPTIARGAVDDGKDFDLGILWPDMRGTTAARFAGGRP